MQRILEASDGDIFVLFSNHEVKSFEIALELNQEALVDVSKPEPFTVHHVTNIVGSNLFSQISDLLYKFLLDFYFVWLVLIGVIGTKIEAFDLFLAM